jgi:hypothetical protein
MSQFLNLEPSVWEKTGFSDLECYFRAGNVWDYTWKFRRIDAGVRLGALIPSGVRRNVNNPVSIPFGGDGRWGVYLAADCQLELKEDLSAGLLAQYNQRFSRKRTMRIPVADEQQLFGAAVGPLLVEPDATLIFSPYVVLEGIRDGLGARAQYTVVTHFSDSFVDKRTVKNPPATLNELIKRSDWTAEYITVDAFYDFGKVWQDDCNSLIISAMIDIPINWLVGEHAANTTRVSLGVQYLY